MASDRTRGRFAEGSSIRIAIIGGGKMGEAMLAGWLRAEAGIASSWSAADFTVVNPGSEKRERLSRTYGVRCVADAAALEAADLIVLAVKPQVMFDVLHEIESLPFVSGALCISVAAGIGTRRLEQALPAGTHVVRAMPNTPLLIGAGATTLCKGSNADEGDIETARALFASIGEAFVVDEALMDATGAINGSGPAYVAALVEALAHAGAAAGLDLDLAEHLAAVTVVGTGRMMVERGQSAAQTRLDVCSPKGTTLAALDAMEGAGFSHSVEQGVEAAIRRSKELGA